MSLTVVERKERENRLFPLLLVHFVSNTFLLVKNGKIEWDNLKNHPVKITFLLRRILSIHVEKYMF